MATFRDLLNAIKQAKADLIANRENDALKIAFDQVALTKLRIQSSGENAYGQKFPDYVPGYKRDRQKKGYQVEFVDLFQTQEAAQEAKDRLLSVGGCSGAYVRDDGTEIEVHIPWSGYFENLNELNVQAVRVNP